jgi:RNA polymerase sigma-70 factor (ECF subfamily)
MSTISLIFSGAMEGEESPVRRRRARNSFEPPTSFERSSATLHLPTVPEIAPDYIPEPVEIPASDPLSIVNRSGVRSDVELLHAFQLGDERAFAELYTRRKREIYTFCVRMLGGDRDLANDAFQETFIKVYEKGDSFRSGSNVMGWLFMIARNTCLNLHRSKRPSEALDDQPALVSNDRSLGPEYGEEQHFLRELLENAITTLPEEFREPFIMREFDGFSYGEIAKVTHTTLATTKVRIYRAKQQLRELLRPYLQDDAQSGLSNLIDQQHFGPIPEEDRP